MLEKRPPTIYFLPEKTRYTQAISTEWVLKVSDILDYAFSPLWLKCI